MGTYSGYDFNKLRNPQVRRLFEQIFDIVNGHDHDGTNTKAVSAIVATVDDLAITNAKLAADVKVGSLAALTTTAKTSLQAAINELVTAVGALSGLSTTDKTNIVLALNEVVSNVGDKATLLTTAKSNLVAAINELKSGAAADVTLTGVQTLTNKTLTSAVLTTPKIDDGDVGCIITSADQTNASAVVTIPNIGDAADEFVMADTIQTLTNKTLTTPSITNAIEAGVSLAASDVTLSATQKVKAIIEVTTGHAANAIIAPQENRTYVIVNNDAVNNVLIKKAAGTPVTIPPSSSAIVYYNGTEYIMVACNEVTKGNTAILTNKTLTSPKITQNVATHDYSGAAADWTLTADDLLAQVVSVSNANGAVNAIFTNTTTNYYLVYNNSGFDLTCKNAAGTALVIPNNKHSFIWNDGTNIVGIDSFVNPILKTPVLDDGDAGCTITSADQTNASATITIPDCGDAADEFVLKDTAQTLTNKTLTAPAISAPDFVFGSSAVNYAGGHADYTLSAAEIKSTFLLASNADAPANILAPATANKVYCVTNGSGQAVTILVSGQTGITIANGKSAFVRCNGADYVRLTADA